MQHWDYMFVASFILTDLKNKLKLFKVSFYKNDAKGSLYSAFYWLLLLSFSFFFCCRCLCFPHILTAAELSKGFWSTALRSKPCPSWMSCISILNSWARWAHLSPVCPCLLNPPLTADVTLCLLGAVLGCFFFFVDLHAPFMFEHFIFYLFLPVFCCCCYLSSCGFAKWKMNVLVLLAVITSDLWLFEHPPCPPHLFHLEISRRIIGDDTQNILYSVPWCAVQGQSNLPLSRRCPHPPPPPRFFLLSLLYEVFFLTLAVFSFYKPPLTYWATLFPPPSFALFSTIHMVHICCFILLIAFSIFWSICFFPLFFFFCHHLDFTNCLGFLKI